MLSRQIIHAAHLWHTEQWCALSGLMLQHFGHLKMTLKLKFDLVCETEPTIKAPTTKSSLKTAAKFTCPSSNPILWMFSLVAFPFGTAPETFHMEKTAPFPKDRNYGLFSHQDLWALCADESWQQGKQGPFKIIFEKECESKFPVSMISKSSIVT